MPDRNPQYDAIIIGAGAAGLMCAISAGQRGLKVLVLEHAKRIGKKILMSGGGRCNFTHLECGPENFISTNPHFCKSALARYTPWDFLDMVNRHEIPWHEKTPGQLFCDRSSKDIVAMLAEECSQADAEIRTSVAVSAITKTDPDLLINSSIGDLHTKKLVIATGGLSIPKMGATDFGHRIAKQFGLKVLPLRAALVPFTLPEQELKLWSELSGVSLPVTARSETASFQENMLFTHRGLSGPAMLQLSSYWEPGENIETNLFPEKEARQWLDDLRQQRPRLSLRNALVQELGKRFTELFCKQRLAPLASGDENLADLNRDQIDHILQQLEHLSWQPNGTEGYRTAEVTLGGVDTDALSSSSFECKTVPGLHFIGEVVDVTGQLGGYNFQWAWASGWCAGQAL